MDTIKAPISLYHVVTERPMYVGQTILLGGEQYNGVHRRVAAFQDMLAGKELEGELAALLGADPVKWGKVAYRELALEQVRVAEYPQYPSRMACLYTAQTIEEAQEWAKFFKEIGRVVYSIVRLEVRGSIFYGDACNCFDGVEDMEENMEKARQYWQNSVQNERPVAEVLADGELFVAELVEQYEGLV